MIKKFILALAISAGLLSSAHAAGTIPLSMTQQLDQYGVPLSGCLLYTIQAGTTSTPQNAFKDTALSLVQPNPMVCDASGRLPQFFLADGQIKIRLLDKLGNPQVTLDNILVIGPSSGGGSGATIDPTTIASTGDIKQAYGTQVITGWVRFNGRTIGNATSGATERANADTQALFLYLWGADPNLTVSGGRTTAAADYAANKTITLPDARGRAIAGLDDMGNTAAGRLTATYFGSSGACSSVSATLLGAACGGESKAFLQPNLPNVNFTVTDPGHQHNIGSGTSATALYFQFAQTSGAPNFNAASNTASATPFSGILTAAATTGISVNSGGSGTPFTVMQPTILVTVYIKL